MKSSIRHYLLINVLLAIALVMVLIILIKYYIWHTSDISDAWILLFAIPLMGVLIWFIVSKGLNSLTRLSKELANRAPSHLEPVNMANLPEEIQPVIDELNKLFFRLKEGFGREKRFAADAAHELRTPLAAIKTQTQVALNSQSLEEKDHALQKVLASVNRSAHIVQQLLIMSKLSSEDTSSQPLEKVNLPVVTRDILALLAPAALEKNIDLEFSSDDKDLILLGNSTAIGILVRNLVDNAIRYCEENGHVVVRIDKKASAIVLTVCDDGPGIPEEVRSRVFERFFRVLGNKRQGSGLGLAIVQQIAMLHHAEIELESPLHGSGLIVHVIFKRENLIKTTLS